MTPVEKNDQLFIDAPHFLKFIQCPLWFYLSLSHASVEKRGVDTLAFEPSRHSLLRLVEKHPLFSAANPKVEEIIYHRNFNYGRFSAYFDIQRKTTHKSSVRTEGYLFKTASRVISAHMSMASYVYYLSKLAKEKIDRLFLIYVNKKYVMTEKPEPAEMFVVKNITDQINLMQDSVFSNIKFMNEVAELPSEPHVKIGPHCYSPVTCAYISRCWKDVPKHSVFNISGMDKQTQFDMYEKGVVTLNDIDLKQSPLNESQKFQVKSFQENHVIIDKKKLQAFLKKIRFPIYFLDFEAYTPPIPIIPNTRPYQNIPFLYSLHRLDKNGEVSHRDCLTPPGENMREVLLRRILADLGDTGTICIYGEELERAVLAQWKKVYPEFGAKVDNIGERFLDLSTPFRKKYYYHPDMHGSYSMKKIGPAMLEGVSYNDLEIRHGGEAARVFETLQYIEDRDRLDYWINALKEYCKTDTYVILGLYKILKNAIS